jgi:hypothetical protein
VFLESVPNGSETYEEEDYKDVVAELQAAGFSDIETKSIEDLITGWLTKDGEIEKISINGDSQFDSGTWFPVDSKVRITYHTFPSEEKKKFDTPTPSPKETTKPDKSSDSKKSKLSKFNVAYRVKFSEYYIYYLLNTNKKIIADVVIYDDTNRSQFFFDFL